MITVVAGVVVVVGMVVMWLFGVATRFVLMLGVNIITSVGCGAVDDIIGNLCGAGDVAGVGDHSG